MLSAVSGAARAPLARVARSWMSAYCMAVRRCMWPELTAWAACRALEFRRSLLNGQGQHTVRAKRHKHTHQREQGAATAAEDGIEKRHCDGEVVVPGSEPHTARIVRLLLDQGGHAHAAVLSGDSSAQRDLFIGTDVEFVPSEKDKPRRAAVVQFAVADFVAVIPLYVLTQPDKDTPLEERAVEVRCG